MRRDYILNKLIQTRGYKSYLEIGVKDGRTSKRIICDQKITVDPNPINYDVAYKLKSDEFFKLNKNKFDIIFIDGLHQDDQVERDILNSLECLNENGTILVHDCLPPTELSQSHIPVKGSWCGTVWKAIVRLRATRKDLSIMTIDTDFGCGIIQRGNQTCISMPKVLDYNSFQKNKKKWMNMVTVEEASQLLNFV